MSFHCFILLLLLLQSALQPVVGFGLLHYIDATNDEMGKRNNVVDTANRYGLDGWGFDYLWDQEVSLLRTHPYGP
jgi:hypothetical protein